MRLKCCSVLSLFWQGRTSIANVPLWELSSLPEHSDDWRAYNGSLICVPWRMQHARTPSCSKHLYNVTTHLVNTSIIAVHLSSGNNNSWTGISLKQKWKIKECNFEPSSQFYSATVKLCSLCFFSSIRIPGRCFACFLTSFIYAIVGKKSFTITALVFNIITEIFHMWRPCAEFRSQKHFMINCLQFG